MVYSKKYYSGIEDWLELSESINEDNFAWVLKRWFNKYQCEVLEMKFEYGCSITQIAKGMERSYSTIVKLLERLRVSLKRYSCIFVGDVSVEERKNYLVYYMGDYLYDKDIKVLNAYGFTKVSDLSRGKLYDIRGSLTSKAYSGLKDTLLELGISVGLGRLKDDYPANIFKLVGISREDVNLGVFNKIMNEMYLDKKLTKVYEVGMLRFRDCKTLDEIATNKLGGVTKEAARLVVEKFIKYVSSQRLKYDVRFEKGSKDLLNEELGSKYTKVFGTKLVCTLCSNSFITLGDVHNAGYLELRSIQGLGVAKLDRLVLSLDLLGFAVEGRGVKSVKKKVV